MYSLGVPVGVLVDRRGTRPFVLVGAVLLVSGYFPLHWAYDSAGSSLALLCFFSFLTGLGSCMSFAAAVKTSALNWPHHRGTATAFPLAAFGLSAFFFSSLGGFLFPGDPSAFLKLLAWGTFGLTFTGFFFLKVYPHSSAYRALPDSQRRRPSSCSAGAQRLRRASSSADGKMCGAPHTLMHADPDTGTSPGSSAGWPERSTATPQPSSPEARLGPSALPEDTEDRASAVDETSSLMSSCSSAAGENVVASSVNMDRSHRIDIRGFALLGARSFWLLFLIMAILAGIGLMTIKYVAPFLPPLVTPLLTLTRSASNIGNDVNALWKRFDDSVGQDFLVHRQQMHVSILSVCSFVGRLLSGESAQPLAGTYLCSLETLTCCTTKVWDPTSSLNPCTPVGSGACS